MTVRITSPPTAPRLTEVGFHRCAPDTLNIFLFSLCAASCPIAVRHSGDSHRNSANLKVLGGSLRCASCTGLDQIARLGSAVALRK
jgi:hypothetical protein